MSQSHINMLKGKGYLSLILSVTNRLNTGVFAFQDNISCDPRWSDGHAVGLGCLLIESSQTKKTFSQAQKFCQNVQNARLVEILTVEHMNFLVTKLKEKCPYNVRCDWWGGASKKPGGSWLWEESGNPVASFVWVNNVEPTLPDPDLQYSSCFNSTLDYQGSACRGFRKLLPICQRKYVC